MSTYCYIDHFWILLPRCLVLKTMHITLLFKYKSSFNLSVFELPIARLALNRMTFEELTLGVLFRLVLYPFVWCRVVTEWSFVERNLPGEVEDCLLIPIVDCVLLKWNDDVWINWDNAWGRKRKFIWLRHFGSNRTILSLLAIVNKKQNCKCLVVKSYELAVVVGLSWQSGCFRHQRSTVQ